MSQKSPNEVDREYCQTGNHLWVEKDNGEKILCYTCGKILKEEGGRLK